MVCASRNYYCSVGTGVARTMIIHTFLFSTANMPDPSWALILPCPAKKGGLLRALVSYVKWTVESVFYDANILNKKWSEMPVSHGLQFIEELSSCGNAHYLIHLN